MRESPTYSMKYNNYVLYLKVLSRKKKLHIELLKKMKQLEKQKNFENLINDSLCGNCTICCEPIGYEDNFINRFIANYLIKCNHNYFAKHFPTLLSCGHAYHHTCIHTWFTYSDICPNCGC